MLFGCVLHNYMPTWQYESLNALILNIKQSSKSDTSIQFLEACSHAHDLSNTNCHTQ